MVWRYLKDNKGTESPQNLLFFDCETLPHPIPYEPNKVSHQLRLGVAIAIRLENGIITRRKVFHFTTATEFWQFIETRLHSRMPLYVYAHNIAFDLKATDFFDHLETGYLSLIPTKSRKKAAATDKPTRSRSRGLFIADDPPTVISCWRPNGEKLVFVDTLNYWRTSLLNLGKDLGFPKIPFPAFEEPDSTWFPYCENDALIIEKAIVELIQWVKATDLGQFRLTIASQAMGAFRHRFNKPPILLHDEKPVKELERRSYYGGHVECFYLGEVNECVYQLDVNSIYPYVMKTCLYPRKLLCWEINDKPCDISHSRLGDRSVADVLLNMPSETFPLRRNGMTFHPTGRFFTTLCGRELEYAANIGAIESVYSYAIYETADLFSGFVNLFHPMKQYYRNIGDEMHATFAKIIMNSLYGKFGQKTPQWLLCDDKESGEPWGEIIEIDQYTAEIIEYRALGRVCERRVESEEHPQAFPAIAAFVTADARMLMRRLRGIAGEMNCHYQAVDALYVNQEGYKRLQSVGVISKGVLGQFDEPAIAVSAEFRGLSDYRFGDKQVRGSIKAKAIELADGAFRQDHFQHLASILKNPKTPGITVETVEKRLSHQYLRGNIAENGRVSPLKMTDLVDMENPFC